MVFFCIVPMDHSHRTFKHFQKVMQWLHSHALEAVESIAPMLPSPVLVATTRYAPSRYSGA